MALELKNTPTNPNNTGGYYDEPEIRKYKPQIDLDADYNSRDFYAGPVHSPIKGRKSYDVAYYSNIVLHGLFIVVSLIFLGIAIFRPDNIGYYLNFASKVESFIVIAIIADAIIYNIFVEKDILLLICAFFLNGLYLFRKGKIIDGQISTGTFIIFIVYLVSSLACFFTVLAG